MHGEGRVRIPLLDGRSPDEGVEEADWPIEDRSGQHPLALTSVPAHLLALGRALRIRIAQTWVLTQLAAPDLPARLSSGSGEEPTMAGGARVPPVDGTGQPSSSGDTAPVHC